MPKLKLYVFDVDGTFMKHTGRIYGMREQKWLEQPQNITDTVYYLETFQAFVTTVLEKNNPEIIPIIAFATKSDASEKIMARANRLCPPEQENPWIAGPKLIERYMNAIFPKISRESFIIEAFTPTKDHLPGKNQHIENILAEVHRRLNLTPEKIEVILFEDDKENFDEACKAGYRGVLINNKDETTSLKTALEAEKIILQEKPKNVLAITTEIPRPNVVELRKSNTEFFVKVEQDRGGREELKKSCGQESGEEDNFVHQSMPVLTSSS